MRFVVPAGQDGVAWAVVGAIAAYTVAAESAIGTALAGLVVSLATAVIAMSYDDQLTEVSSILVYVGWFTAPWLAGRAVRRWREREGEALNAVRRSEDEREQSMRAAIGGGTRPDRA